jgi:hypothetical protein
MGFEEICNKEIDGRSKAYVGCGAPKFFEQVVRFTEPEVRSKRDLIRA